MTTAALTPYQRYLAHQNRQAITEQFREEKKAIDLRMFVARDLGRNPQRPGVSNWMFCCPFHDDPFPSLSVSRQLFNCHGCGAAGDIANYVALRDKLDVVTEFEEVVRRIVGNIALNPLPKIEYPKTVAPRKLTMSMVEMGHRNFEKIIPWLISRAISVELAREHKLGLMYNSVRYNLKGGRSVTFTDNRYSIPEVRDNKVIFIQKRRQDKEAREQLTRLKIDNNDLYLEIAAEVMENLPETEDSEFIVKQMINTIWGPKYKGIAPHFNGIYNAQALFPARNNNGKIPSLVAMVAVEGPLDALAMISAGFDTVAVPRNEKLKLGQAFEHVNQPIAMFDNDEAGKKHAEWFKAKLKAELGDMLILDTRPQVPGEDPNDICIAGRIKRHMEEFGLHPWL